MDARARGDHGKRFPSQGSAMGIGAWVDAKHPRDDHGRFTSGDGDASAPKGLFAAKDHASLPSTVTQRTSNKDELVKDAKEAHEQSLDLLDRDAGIAKDIGATIVRGDKGEKVDLEKVKGPVVMIGPMKNMNERAKEKVEKQLGGDYGKLGDVVRSSIAVDSHRDIPKVLEKLEAAGIEIARQPKDRFIKPTDSGYRDALINVKYPNGHVGEIQLHTKALLAAKNGGGHKLYEAVRKVAESAESEKRGLTTAESKMIDATNKAAKRLYDAAWKKSR